MKINLTKVTDGFFATYDNLVCSPVFVKTEKEIKAAVIDEAYRNCYILEQKPPKDVENVEIISKKTLNEKSETFSKDAFNRTALTAKDVKAFKNLYIQSAFLLKSLTDNMPIDGKSTAVNDYLKLLKSDCLSFGERVECDTLMEAAFAALELADKVDDCGKFLLVVNGRIICFAKALFQTTDMVNDPFYFKS